MILCTDDLSSVSQAEMKPTISYMDLLFMVLPFVILAWSQSGRGAIGRGKTQVSMICILAIAGYWAGPIAAAVMLAFVFALGVASVRKHRLPGVPSYKVDSVELRDFRGESTPVASRADALGFEHVIDFQQDIGTALLEFKVFGDAKGTYLVFSRTTLKNGRGDDLWMHSYFPDGVTISSSDEIRSIDFPVPFQLRRMQILADLRSLYDFHRANAAAYSQQPSVFSSDDYLKRVKLDATRRYASGCATGYLIHDGAAYRYSIRSALRTFGRALNLVAALASQETVGGTDSSTIAKLRVAAP